MKSLMQNEREGLRLRLGLRHGGGRELLVNFAERKIKVQLRIRGVRMQG